MTPFQMASIKMSLYKQAVARYYRMLADARDYRQRGSLTEQIRQKP